MRHLFEAYGEDGLQLFADEFFNGVYFLGVDTCA